MLAIGLRAEIQAACVGTSPLVEIVDCMGNQAKIAMAIVSSVLIDMIDAMAFLKAGADEGVQDITANHSIAP